MRVIERIWRTSLQRLAVQHQPARALAGRAQGGARRADGHRPLRRGVRAPADPRGRTYYWMTYNPPYHLEGPETDVTSLCEGYITVTPLHFDLTRYDLLPEVGRWNWTG